MPYPVLNDPGSTPIILRSRSSPLRDTTGPPFPQCTPKACDRFPTRRPDFRPKNALTFPVRKDHSRFATASFAVQLLYYYARIPATKGSRSICEPESSPPSARSTIRSPPSRRSSRITSWPIRRSHPSLHQRAWPEVRHQRNHGHAVPPEAGFRLVPGLPRQDRAGNPPRAHGIRLRRDRAGRLRRVGHEEGDRLHRPVHRGPASSSSSPTTSRNA